MFKTQTTETALEQALALACEHAELLGAAGVAAEIVTGEVCDASADADDWSMV